MLAFASTSRPARRVMVLLPLVLHAAVPWTVQAVDCQIMIGNYIEGSGIQVTAFDGYDISCDADANQIDLPAFVEGFDTRTYIDCDADFGDGFCKISIGPGPFSNFHCPGLEVPCGWGIFWWKDDKGNVDYCYSDRSKGDCYNPPAPTPMPTPSYRVLQAPAPAPSDGEAEGEGVGVGAGIPGLRGAR